MSVCVSECVSVCVSVCECGCVCECECVYVCVSVSGWGMLDGTCSVSNQECRTAGRGGQEPRTATPTSHHRAGSFTRMEIQGFLTT